MTSDSTAIFLQEKFNIDVKTLSFRFPIETLEKLIKKFYKEYNETSFLIHASKNLENLVLKKASQSYFLHVPYKKNIDEHLYIGISDKLSFLIIFDEPKYQLVNDEKSRFFLTFNPDIISNALNNFYEKNNNSFSDKEKKLILRLKEIQKSELNEAAINKFQEVLLVNALDQYNKIKQTKLSEAISYTDESIAITDLQGRIIEKNANFDKSFLSELDKKYIDSITSVISSQTFNELKSKALLNKSHKLEIEINKKNQNELQVVSCFLHKDDLNIPNGFVFSFKDVTDLKKLDNINKKLIKELRERNIELSEANKRLIELDKIKTDLLSVISHELRTPISNIIGFSELISKRELDRENTKNFANQISISAHDLNKLISDYLEVATITFGITQNNSKLTPINLKSLIGECFQDELKKSHRNNVDFNISSIGLEPVIFSEVQNLKKLFSNIISNSIKFMPYSGKITSQILSDGENLTISITDEGIGLTHEQSKHVFEPFYRTDNSLTREFSGIGLGLSLCKKIVSLYNGSIWCEPNLDKGTILFVTLPVNNKQIRENESTKELISEKEKVN